MAKNTTKNIMIVGVGGQGTLLTSRILGGITLDAGYDVKLSEVHGMAQRGGSVVTFVRYGEEVAEPIVEEGQADVLIAFEMLEALRYAHFLKPDGAMVAKSVIQESAYLLLTKRRCSSICSVGKMLSTNGLPEPGLACSKPIDW